MKTNSIFSVFLFTLTASAVPAAHKPDTASTTLQSTETGSAEIGWALNSNETETSDLVGTDPIPILNPSAKRYFLKTHVHNHVRNRHLNNLYVALYPMDDNNFAAILLKGTGRTVIYNGVNVFFDIDFPGKAPLHWAFDLRTSNDYTNWGDVAISTDYRKSGPFKEVDDKLVEQNARFKGWLACDWSLEKTQLFWANDLFNGNPPKGCAKIDLVMRVALE